MQIEKKIPVHIGLFGHIDSGKTAIAKVLSEIISTAGIDAHPQSRERGITIDLGFTSFVLDKYLITLVDGPGHADLIKISAASVEIIDCAIMVIDINKGPQIQTGEHLIMINSLNIKNVLVILNKIDLFNGKIEEEIERIRKFFSSTAFGPNIPIYAVSARNKSGFEDLKKGIYGMIDAIDIKRDIEGDLIIPIDHHFPIKGMGAILTGTIVKGSIKLNQKIEVIPINSQGRVKNIQIYHQNVNSASAGDRVGINVKGVDIKKVFRGCYVTTNPELFDSCKIIDVKVKSNELFKSLTNFGTQVHITIGMFTAIGQIYPYYRSDGHYIQKVPLNEDHDYKAIIIFKEKVLLRKETTIMLLSRLDLPPTTLRIMGSAELRKIYKQTPIFHRFKIKKGYVKDPEHPQGIICSGLAQSGAGAKKIIGKDLEPPFTKILDTFGTKGAVIVGVQGKDIKLNKGDKVILKELRRFHLKNI
jgi:selenocysteine-specific elongation factor